MTENEFIMVLPSDSSMKYYPENTATRFTTLLPEQITLLGRWSVGLKEIQYPCNLLHISNKSDGLGSMKIFDEMTAQVIFTIYEDCLPKAVYKDNSEFLKALNEMSYISDHFLIEYNDGTGFASLSRYCRCSEKHSLKISSRISRMLGFDESRFPWITSMGSILMASKPVSLAKAFPNNFLIYSDLCTPYITGDVKSSLLRVITPGTDNYKYGTTKTHTFSSPNYIPLLKTTFRTIEIDIRDNSGNPIPFEYGPLNVTLHFKKI